MNDEQRREYFIKVNDDLHKLGKLLTIVSIALLVGFAFFITALYNTSIYWDGFVKGIINVGLIYFPVAIVEFLVFAPMVGVGGSYLSFLTGNLTNLKIPCAVNARDIAKVEPGTAENEIVSTISIATSALTTMIVIFLGVMLIVPLTPVLELPVLSPAFENVVAALFGALGLKYTIKQPKIAVVPLVLMTALCIFIPSMISQTSILLIPSGLIALGIGYILLKKGKLKD